MSGSADLAALQENCTRQKHQPAYHIPQHGCAGACSGAAATRAARKKMTLRRGTLSQQRWCRGQWSLSSRYRQSGGSKGARLFYISRSSFIKQGLLFHSQRHAGQGAMRMASWDGCVSWVFANSATSAPDTLSAPPACPCQLLVLVATLGGLALCAVGIATATKVSPAPIFDAVNLLVDYGKMVG